MRVLLPIVALVLAFAGCVEQPAAETSNAAGSTLGDLVANTTTPVAFDGEFGPGLFVCGPVIQCTLGMGTGYRLGSDLEHDANVTAVNLTMSWSAASPLMETLRLGITIGEGEAAEYKFVDGPSPLVLDATGLEVGPDDKLRMWAWLPSLLPVAEAYVTTPQAFKVEGDISG